MAPAALFPSRFFCCCAKREGVDVDAESGAAANDAVAESAGAVSAVHAPEASKPMEAPQGGREDNGPFTPVEKWNGKTPVLLAPDAQVILLSSRFGATRDSVGAFLGQGQRAQSPPLTASI